MSRRVAKVPCPVCSKPFHPKGGLQGHLATSKDSAHVAHRAQQGKAQAEPRGVQEPSPPKEPASVPPQQEGKGQGEAVVQVSFQAAPGGPLLPEQASSTASAAVVRQGAPAGKPASAIQAIPSGQLATVIDGGVAAMCNGFFLRGEGDGQLTPQEVAGLCFGANAEAAVRLYFPNLPWDHPAVLMFVSAAGLAVVVSRKKAPKKPKAKKPEKEKAPERRADDAKPAAKPAPVVVQDPDAPEPPAPEPAAGEGDGTEYWASLAATTGGPGAPGEVDA